jgi:hypothetical protein
VAVIAESSESKMTSYTRLFNSAAALSGAALRVLWALGWLPARPIRKAFLNEFGFFVDIISISFLIVTIR